MKLIVGLGNPGAKYAGNRHNIGFMALDRIASDHGFGPWRSRFQGQVAEGRLGSQKVLLLKPATFMNKSGQAVGEAARFFRIDPGDIIVFHDEIDLAPAKCRVKTGGGHAGHNGLRSIHQHIGPDYQRVRMGVGHPGRKEAVPGYVLHDFAKADQGWLEDVITGCSDGAAALADGDSGRFMNAVSLRVAPPRSSDKPGKSTPPVPPVPPARPAATPASKGRAESPRPEPLADPEPEKSPLQRLMERFSK